MIKIQLNNPKTTPPEKAIIKTKEKDIVKKVNSKLGSRFTLGRRAPASYGMLAADLGELSNTEAAKKDTE